MTEAHDPTAAFDEKGNAREYYGNALQSSEDLRTSACCPIDEAPAHVRAVLALIHPAIAERFYGCGSPIPLALAGLSVLDVGSGSGRDCYVMSKLVGPTGFVTGIDMTDAQVKVARRWRDHQTKAFGYRQANVDFVHDEIEHLERHVAAESLDLVTSNCVLNLVGDKASVLKAIFAVLRDGGELYFSDIYADRRIPDNLRRDPVLHGECLGGALYVNDFLRLARTTGFADARRISSRPVDVLEPEIAERVGNVRFRSITYRLWKLDGLEDRCEDYGHVATYRGGLSESPHRFVLDDGHVFEKGRPERVCGNTALMLSRTRFAPYFDILGDFSEHFGDFRACGTATTDSAGEGALEPCC